MGRKLNVVRLLLAIASMFVGVVFGHSALEASLPAEGSAGPAPKSFELRFAHPVRLTAMTLHGQSGSTKVGKLPEAPATSLTVPAPALSPGKYQLEWRAVGHDGHVMTGKITFEVKAAHGKS
jgi:methionine-rich copper-binding protein CopC